MNNFIGNFEFLAKNQMVLNGKMQYMKTSVDGLGSRLETT